MHLSKPTLLVVDDDELMLETLKRLLGHFGFNVIAYSDSVMALSELQKRNDIAMMVCDYEMPEVNGEDLARAAKKRFPNMPVFVLSGAHPPMIADVQPWDAWFLKGAPITELIRKLNAVLPLATAVMNRAPRVPDGEKRHDDSVAVS